MREYRKILRNREARIVRRLRRKQWCSQVKSMMSGGNIHYEMSGKAEAITCGGIGAFHHLVRRVGLVKEIDRHLHLLKVHLPCHESDHVLNIACNALVGGQRLEDIELRRQDATFLDALGAQRLPDPTTAGDFTRRFRPSDIETLMDCINRVRTRIWKKRARGELKEALIDIDGSTPQADACAEGVTKSSRIRYADDEPPATNESRIPKIAFRRAESDLSR